MKTIGRKEDAVVVLRDILEALLSDIYAYREGVLKEDDNEVLHQFRITVRRSVVVMSEFSFLDQSGAILLHRKALKTLISISNRKRDLDVLYGRVCSLGSEAGNSGGKDDDEALQLLKERLEEMLQKEHRSIQAYLLSQTCTEILGSWEAYLSKEYFSTVADNRNKSINNLSDKVIYKRFLKIKKQIVTLDRKSGKIEENLHALRISYKKLRYLLETFASLYRKKKIQKLLKKIKKIQNVPGAFHDSYQQEMLLEEWIKEEKNETLRKYLKESLQPDLEKYRAGEVKKIKKQLKRFLKKQKH